MKLGLIAASVFVLAASAGAAVGPPVIREPWTQLTCPAHPSSTVEIEGCLERDVTRSDRSINAKASAVFRLIKRRVDREAHLADLADAERMLRHA